MEEEARQILRAVLNETEPAPGNLAERIRRRFAKLGEVQIPIATREPVRYLDFSVDARKGSAIAQANAGKAKAKRLR